MKKTSLILAVLLLFLFSFSVLAAQVSPYEQMIKVDFEVTVTDYQYSLKVTNNTDYDILSFQLWDYQLSGTNAKPGSDSILSYPFDNSPVVVPAHNSVVFSPIKVIWHDCDNMVTLVYYIEFSDGIIWGISHDTYNSIVNYAKEVRTTYYNTPVTTIPQTTQTSNQNDITDNTVLGFFIFVIFVVLIVLLTKKKKKKKAQPNILQQPKEIVKDAGSVGEFLAYDKLFSLPGNKRLLHNIYLRKPNGETTEIDVLLIHEKGLFVIESKNYSGHIWGSPKDNQWTQVLSHRNHFRFYNPVMQNRGHVKNLITVLSYSLQDAYRDIPVYSVIVFSDKTDIEKVDKNGLDANIKIIQQHEIIGTLSDIIMQSQTQPYSAEDLNKIYSALVPLTNVTEEEKQKHIADINAHN